VARHLFNDWDAVSTRILNANAVLLFLDFDGTLVPLQRAYDEVTFGPQTRRALRRLTGHRRVTVVIVSGRRRGVLVRLLGLARVQYWGLYGWEQKTAHQLPAAVRRDLSRARAELTASLGALSGVRIEDKGMSVCVHTRGASRRNTRLASAQLRQAVIPYRSRLRVLQGRDTWDVLPRTVGGKGVAVRAALRRVRAPVLPIYVGDDVTDEPAFAALGRGITVHVGARLDTRAGYRLSDPDEVRGFIERLAEVLS
jgi:trehalose-phosphatase